MGARGDAVAVYFTELLNLCNLLEIVTISLQPTNAIEAVLRSMCEEKVRVECLATSAFS